MKKLLIIFTLLVGLNILVSAAHAETLGLLKSILQGTVALGEGTCSLNKDAVPVPVESGKGVSTAHCLYGVRIKDKQTLIIVLDEQGGVRSVFSVQGNTAILLWVEGDDI